MIDDSFFIYSCPECLRSRLKESNAGFNTNPQENISYFTQ